MDDIVFDIVDDTTDIDRNNDVVDDIVDGGVMDDVVVPHFSGVYSVARHSVT